MQDRKPAVSDPEDTIRRALLPDTTDARRISLLESAASRIDRNAHIRQIRDGIWPHALAAWSRLTRGQRTDALWSDIEHIRWYAGVPAGEVVR